MWTYLVTEVGEVVRLPHYPMFMEKVRQFEVHIRDKEERKIDCFTHKWVNTVTSRMKLGVSETLKEEQLEISLQVTSEESVFRNYEEVDMDGTCSPAWLSREGLT